MKNISIVFAKKILEEYEKPCQYPFRHWCKWWKLEKHPGGFTLNECIYESMNIMHLVSVGDYIVENGEIRQMPDGYFKMQSDPA